MKEQKNEMEEVSKIKVSGYVIFFASIVGGWLGLHCVIARRYRRACVYFLMGGTPFACLNGLMNKSGPVWFYFIAYSLMFIQIICNLIDTYKISRGNYTDKTGNIIYTKSRWMPIVFIMFAFLYLRSFYYDVIHLAVQVVKLLQ